MKFHWGNFVNVNFLQGRQLLELVRSFLDLGTLLDVMPSFVLHINMMVNKARAVIAVVKRWGKKFTDP